MGYEHCVRSGHIALLTEGGIHSRAQAINIALLTEG